MKEQGGELQVEGSVCRKPWRGKCGFKNKAEMGGGGEESGAKSQVLGMRRGRERTNRTASRSLSSVRGPFLTPPSPQLMFTMRLRHQQVPEGNTL